jgi:protein SCO1/2
MVPMGRLLLRTALIALALVGVAACGSASRKPAALTHDAPAAATSPHLQGILLSPPRIAPTLAANNFTGEPVNLAAFRGKAVFLTFLYTHCPDVCPLIAASMAAAQRDLGALASRVQMIAVSVDPKGDTPESVRQFLSARDAVGRMDYLIGSRAQLLPIWRRWGIEVTINGKTVSAGHSALVFAITPEGKVVEIYPSNFTPGELVHDVPLLLRS